MAKVGRKGGIVDPDKRLRRTASNRETRMRILANVPHPLQLLKHAKESRPIVANSRQVRLCKRRQSPLRIVDLWQSSQPHASVPSEGKSPKTRRAPNARRSRNRQAALLNPSALSFRRPMQSPSLHLTRCIALHSPVPKVLVWRQAGARPLMLD